jgi:hypothetical protein
VRGARDRHGRPLSTSLTHRSPRYLTPLPTPPDASATAVTVRRPGQWIHPASTGRKTRYVGAWKHGSNAASMPTSGLGTMISGMAPSLVSHTSRVFEGATFRQLMVARSPKWRKAGPDAGDGESAS